LPLHTQQGSEQISLNLLNHGSLSEDGPRAQPWSDPERLAIVEEMNRILADSAFKGSKRCQALLRWLVERALAGDNEGMKERSLGVEVFGRDPSYDTATDPVVRTTANEIRKRLGQWYQEPHRRHSVRISLIAGSYLPKFDFESLSAGTEIPDEKPLTTDTGIPLPHITDVNEKDLTTKNKSGFRLNRMLGGVATILVVTAIVALIRSDVFTTAEFKIWQPLTAQQAPLTLILSDEDWQADAHTLDIQPMDVMAKVITSRELPQKASEPIFDSTYPVIDAFLANKITNRIAFHGKQTTLRRSSELSFDDLRHEPIVIIGGTNPWSLILLSKLRYSVRVDPVTNARWIQDSKNPSSRQWRVSGSREQADVDYAIVSRFRDPETGQWIVSLGGLWAYGTISACSFLTDPEYSYMLPKAFHESQNAQVVLKTDVINGNPGPPQVLAAYTW
jgi:hypothetical protein